MLVSTNNEWDTRVKLDSIDIDGTLKEIKSVLANEKDLSPALKSIISILVLVVKRLTNRGGLNSKNSSIKLGF